MTPEEKSLLERTCKMAEENNGILRKMRRANRWGTAVRVLYWVVIVGAAVGAFYYLQPYINSAMDVISKAQSAINSAVNQTPR
jgi:hypothetical protein